MPFFVHASTRTEQLALLYGKFVAENPSLPFQRETTIVQSRGMEQYLKLQIAKQNGIVANFYFSFPAKILGAIFETIEAAKVPFPFDPRNLMWRIYVALPSLIERPEFRMVRHFLESQNHSRYDLKRYELAMEIASLFDRYAVQRPDMVRQWSGGECLYDDPDELWQSILWREIVAGPDLLDPIERYDRLSQFLENASHPSDFLPEWMPGRFSIFGGFTLPVLYRELFMKLAQRIDIHYYHLETMEFDSDSSEENTNSGGNPLLQLSGRSGIEFSTFLRSVDGVIRKHHPVAPDRDQTKTLLQQVQSDIFTNRTRETEKITVQESDRSIQIVSCHTSLREVEVLYDHLLRFFETAPGATPADVLIMVKDIERYMPLIHAVFEKQTDRVTGKKLIPYSIADVHSVQEKKYYDLFKKIFELSRGRFARSELLAFLEDPVIEETFQFAEPDLAVIRAAIQKAEIRWGYDGEFKQKLGVPGVVQNTWRRGMDRLLLGYLMTGEAPFASLLPVEMLHGESFACFAKFESLVEMLHRHTSRFKAAHTTVSWSNLLLELLGEFVDSDRDSSFAGVLRSIGEIDLNEAVELEIVERELETLFVEKKYGHSFLSGSVTFSKIFPMRSIPARFIGFLGLNESDFPAKDSGSSFDLFLRYGRPSDRSKRMDDRQLFLEAVLCARDSLYISYTGHDPSNHAKRESSVVVSELVDYIGRHAVTPSGEPVSCVINHHMHGFHPDYFLKNDSLYSYSKTMFRAAQTVVGKKNRIAPFFEKPVPLSPDDDAGISGEDFIRFFQNPSRAFLKRLKFRTDFIDDETNDIEPFLLNGLERYLLKEEIMELALSGSDRETMRTRLEMGDSLPHQKAGEIACEIEFKNIDPFLSLIRRLHDEKGVGDLSFQIELNGGTIVDCHLRAILDDNNLYLYRPATLRSRDYIRAWILHLLLNARTDWEPCTTHLFGTGSLSHVILSPPAAERGNSPETALTLLEACLELYREGQTRPLPFFPETSLAWCESALKVVNGGSEREIGSLFGGGKISADALKSAKSKWESSYGTKGEYDRTAEFFLCFRRIALFDGASPMREDFERISRTFYGPMLESLEIGEWL